MDDPGLGVVGDNRLPRLMRSILHPRFGAYLESFINPLQNALARHLPGARDLAYGLTGMVAPQNLRPLDVAESGGSRLAKLIEMGFLLVGQNQLRAPALECSAEDAASLTTISKSRTEEARTVERARIVLACLEGKENQQVAQGLGVSVPTVSKWRKRFAFWGLRGLRRNSSAASPGPYRSETHLHIQGRRGGNALAGLVRAPAQHRQVTNGTRRETHKEADIETVSALLRRDAQFAQSLGTNHVTTPRGAHDPFDAITFAPLLDQFHQKEIPQLPHVLADLLAGQAQASRFMLAAHSATLLACWASDPRRS